jgi:phage tail sheath protein FI
MAIFSPVGKAPGVYIEEIAVPGPIPGVTTNIAAFVGPAVQGPLFKPTFITSLKQFWKLFGSYIEDPYRVYVTHAVKGFFDEGGTQCWFVRVGTGVAPWLELKDQNKSGGKAVLRVTALQEGKPAAGKDISVQVDPANAGSSKAARPKLTGAISMIAGNKNQIKTDKSADAALFNPGDTVFLENAAKTKNESAVIFSIAPDAAANSTTFTMSADLANDYAGGSMRIADITPSAPGTPAKPTVVRVEDVTGFETGTYVTIAQGAITEDAIVKRVDTTNKLVYLTSRVSNLYTMKDGDADVTLVTQEFTLTLTAAGKPTEKFEKLAMDPRHSRYFANMVQSALVSMDYSDPPSTTLPAKNVPAKVNPAVPLAGGADESLAGITANLYIQGLGSLARTNVNLLCLPDAVGSKMSKADTQAIQTAMVNHCQKLQDRFGILDPRPVTDKNNFFPDITVQRTNLNSDNGYAALYFPWIKIASPFDSTRILVPPSGHLAGVYANNDNTRGVGKAPANEPITMALDVEIPLADEDQGPLNDVGINGIRAFPNSGIRIWGARTITPPDTTQWRYVNIRRLLIYIEKSIQEGTRFAVFEPNNPSLWGKLKRIVDDFLTGVWSSGALEGVTPDKSFRVRIDEDLNPSASIALGILTAEIIIFPAPPAEFVVFQIIQEPGGSFVSESA